MIHSYEKVLKESSTGIISQQNRVPEFMRTIRLRRAAEMLHGGHLSITEISYAAGFSSVSYFNRCFRAMYGMSPTQFMEKSDFR
jgi:AraC-like DNA-binding protein